MKNRVSRFRVFLLLLWIIVLWGCSSSGLEDKSQLRGGYEIVEGGVIFRFYDPDATKVFLVGDFNNWTMGIDPMVDKNGDGEWTLFYPLKPGRYEYKFVVNGTYWIPDPRNPVSVSDGFEGENSVVVIP